MPAAVSSLIKSLGSDEPRERQSAAEQLLHLGPGAVPASVALVEAADSDEETRNFATAALEDLGAPTVEMVMPLAAMLQRSTLDAPYWAATLLGRLAGDAAPAVKSLVAAAKEHPQTAVRQRAVWALGQIGPPAAAAIVTLEQLSADPDRRLSSLAKDALGEIRG